MDLGKLNTYCTLEAPTTSTDAFAVVTLSWSKVCDFWATYSPVSSRDRLTAPGPIAQDAGSLICHPLIVPAGARVIMDGKPYHITSTIHPEPDITVLTIERMDV